MAQAQAPQPPKRPYCFVIGPYGKVGSDVRKWSDGLFNGLIQPVLTAAGYDCSRLIDDTKPGDITDQIIQKLMESDLVIADLTYRNPNVFYELAVRHATGKDFILLQAPSDEKIPFDITVLHVIEVENTILGAQQARTELEKHIQKTQKGEASFENPITRYRDRLSLKQTAAPQDKVLLELMDQVRSLSNMVESQQKKLGRMEAEEFVRNALRMGATTPLAVNTSLLGTSGSGPGIIGTGPSTSGSLYDSHTLAALNLARSGPSLGLLGISDPSKEKK